MDERRRWRPTRKVWAVAGALALGVALAQQPVQQALSLAQEPAPMPEGTLRGIATPAFTALGTTTVQCPQALREDPVFESACASYNGNFEAFRAAWATATGAKLKGRSPDAWGYSKALGAHVLSYDLGTGNSPATAFMAAFHPLPDNKGEVRVSLRVK